MSLIQANLAATLAPSTGDLAAAFRGVEKAHSSWEHVSLYKETAQRRRMRMLLDGAGLAGARVSLGFLKLDLSLRYMQCIPVPGCDQTCKYVTVIDLELSEQAERAVHRRVCLDTIAAVSIDYRAGEGGR